MVATTIAMMSEAISAIIPIIMNTGNIRAVMGGFIIPPGPLELYRHRSGVHRE